MSFTQVHLHWILPKFSLVQLATQTNGYIHVFTRFECYHFHPEEIFFFLMTKCRSGYSNCKMCDLIFGRHSLRWSFGYWWILEYLNMRYPRTLLHKKLLDYVGDFPSFYDAINRFIQKSSIHHFTDNTANMHDGLNFLPFSILASLTA